MRRFSILSLLILVSLVAYPQTSTYEKTVVSSSVWSENPVIATSTQQNGMAVYENYVYMVYYNTDRNMCIARNSNYGVGEWVTVVLPHVYEQRRLSNGDIVYDNHNTPNIAISPNDKRIHLAFDLHAADLRYIISDENAAIASDANFTASLFSATRNYLQSSERAITLTTYPRFFVGADNKLFIMYRVGGSGSGDTFLGEYKDDGFWFSPGKLISRDGNYNGSTSRCAYFNDVHYADGKIYLTWVWRETPDGTTNHDLMFAYSDDNGQTWRNSAGTSLAIPMSLNSPGINVATIPTGSGLTNHNGCTVDGHGNVHVTHRISGAYKHFVGVRAGGTFNWSSGNTITTFAGDRSKVYADPKTNDLYFMVRHGASLKMFTTASNGELWNQWSQKNEISDKFITSGNSFMNAAGDKLTSMTVSSDDRLQIIRWSLSTNSPTISEKVDLTKFTTDGIYAIYNVGHDKYITPRSTTGGNIAMTAGTADEFKWIIKQNGDKYNIMTVDEQLLLGSNGDQGRLLDNTATRRNDATGGTSSGSGGFLITFEQTSTATLLKNPEYTLKPIWNGNRTSNQYVGMSDKEINSDWHLIRLGDLPGASNTWTGATSKAWDVAGNWSANAVPTATDPVVIADVANKPVIASGNIEVLSLDISDAAMLTVSTGASLSIPGALTATGTGHVVVESGASLLTSGSVTGTSHVFKRTTTFDSNTGKYSVVGSPVSGASTSSLGSLVYSYDETVAFGSDGSARFKEVTTPETMAGGNAYFSAFTGEVTFTGTPHTGDVSVPLAYDANDGENAGFNLVSNPYPAAINYLELIKETNNPNISGTVYLWDDGGSDVGQRSNSDYITVNLVGEVGSATNGSGRSGDWNGHIGSAQGFFVKVTKTDANLNFNNTMKVTGNNASANYFRTEGDATPEIQSVKISLSNTDGAMNESLVGFVADATEGYDRLYDADKIGALNGLKLYTLMGQSRLAIQGLPIADESIIPLGVSVDVAGEYTVKIEDIANISDGKFIYLEDTQLGKITKLEKGNEYTFTSGAGVDESRFNLIVSNSMSVLSLDDLDKQGLNVLYNQRGLTISNSDAQASQAQVTILDISGAVLLTEIIEENEGQSVIDFQFETHRVYILQVSTSSKSTTLKIIFQ